MATNHAVVWLDHAEAHVIHFTPESSDSEVIKTHSSRSHLHNKAGSNGSGHAPENAPYFNDIAHALQGSREILIVGPGNEKLALLKHLQKHQHELAEKVFGVETVDHPSDAQLLAFARKYFVKADLMH